MNPRVGDDPGRQYDEGRGLLGVVLCGGQSRRMGSDKGLLKKDGRPWALHMAEKLRRLDIPVIFSINPTQQDSYSGIIAPAQWVVDSQGLAGPLEGLYSVHQRYPLHDIFLLSCDLLDIDAPTTEGLLAAYKEGSADFYAYEADGVLQPLCAIYTAQALGQVASVPSLKALLRAGIVRRLPGSSAAFRNYNE